jgi:hypothetical protein
VSHQDPAAGGRPPTEEEMRAMEEQMRRIRVQDVLFQTVATLVSLGGRRLGLAPEAQDERDLEQARLAVEGVRALTPLLGAEEGRAVKEALSQLQIAYAREAQQPEGAGPQAGEPAVAGTGPSAQEPSPGGDPSARPAREGQAAGSSPQEEAERAKARSKIWTPRGS